MARWLADRYQVPEAAVGYAGMKDKHAVTEQWFSVHTPLDADVLPRREGVRLCAASRHRRKLRRGRLAGNRFRVRLRNVVETGWSERLAAVGGGGVPNYFGPQRFGSDNLERAQTWLEQRRRRREGGFRTGLYLSVLRSFLFNEVLAMRVRSGTWNRLLPGDVAMPLPSCRGGDADRGSPGEVPSGPLWGRGRSPAGGEALELERAALASHATLCDGLEHAGLAQERRSLVLKPVDLHWQAEEGGLELTFALAPGGYATTLLAEVFDLGAPGERP